MPTYALLFVASSIETDFTKFTKRILYRNTYAFAVDMGALGSTRRATDKTNAHLKIRTPEETRKLIEAVRKKAASGDREAQNQMVRFGARSGRPTSLRNLHTGSPHTSGPD